VGGGRRKGLERQADGHGTGRWSAVQDGDVAEERGWVEDTNREEASPQSSLSIAINGISSLVKLWEPATLASRARATRAGSRCCTCPYTTRTWTRRTWRELSALRWTLPLGALSLLEFSRVPCSPLCLVAHRPPVRLVDAVRVFTCRNTHRKGVTDDWQDDK